ncbi:Phosphoenolpyruvate synthase [Thioalkalivibrio nitratireducens DSM 14787]|uniref:Phosphoenolpyruvate synthase n=1 Tax=Thioalkalivibrio nitratireducens (strain DSM 14787 / UNIQEM 213 / ALEN2) TaxID=1255043 RepID=L0E1V6_THIND|nr:phosphoenolpyruvate synthase [Thioalkalivibrio nitratireducens]AGA35190.1 Phosphoenolpyruvate synthase [Thioalkalivibrio nitratireducens DSM 14787]
MSWVIDLAELTMGDVAQVGGKNASLGELLGNLAEAGVQVPGGFATTADAFRAHLAQNGLDRRIQERLAGLDIDDIQALQSAGREVRDWIEQTPLLPELEAQVREHYARLGDDVPVAVRSSATAEDLPEASFAGQQETYLNVRGIDAVLRALRQVFASLYNDRAIAYREHQGFAHDEVALSAGVQRMVRSDIGCSGVVFTLDTETGFRDAVFITGAWGLGETVVQGSVNPDEYQLYKPALRSGKNAIIGRTLGSKAIRMVLTDSGGTRVEDTPEDLRTRFCLSDEQAQTLGRYAVAIEDHYGRPMDIEWAEDGETGELMIVQARPETVESRVEVGVSESYRLAPHDQKPLAVGRAIGARIGAGRIRVVESPDAMHAVERGDILVADMTDPDWEPIMKRASAIVTNRGGRTCHAAIIAREMGIPAVVGCGDATEVLTDGVEATVSCAEGDDGYVYDGRIPFEVQRTSAGDLPPLPVKLMLNVANPGRAYAFSRLPHAGIGLARLEFIINSHIGIHPLALLDYPKVPEDVRAEIATRIAGFESPEDFFVRRLSEGIGTLAAAFAPQPVIVRLSDFKSNEYAHLLGGRAYEPDEENPMLGFRGASRYLADSFRPAFSMECRALKRVREDMGLDNVQVMVPFVRTLDEAQGVLSVLEEEGLKRGENGLKVVMMCEIPSNALLANRFLDLFDGFSIGSNDLTQLTLGLDRDSALVAAGFDERDDAVKALLSMAIRTAREKGKYVGICGQGPSDHMDLAEWLVAEGIESMSLNPDSLIPTWERLVEVVASG